MMNQACYPATMIVCTVPRGLGSAIIKTLYERIQIINIQHDTGRGIYGHHDLGHPEWQEIDMLNIIVHPEHSDETFRTLYELTDLHLSHGRYIYQAAIPCATEFSLPLMRELQE
jgi:hypothetical protein